MSKQKLIIFVFFYNFLFPQEILLKTSTISSSGIHVSDESTKLVGTVGQSFTGKAASDTTLLFAGFWGSVSLLTLDVDDVLPVEFSVSNAYPNPFNPTVSIDFSIPRESDVYIKIFDLLGRNVFNHKQDFTSSGKYRFQWNGLNNSGKEIASGVYFVTIRYQKNIYNQKITFLK